MKVHVKCVVATVLWIIAWSPVGQADDLFGPQKVITTAADDARSVHAADLDGDGDVDVLSASFSDDIIAWYENTDGLGTFGPQQVITTAADGAQAVHAADLDGDGDGDVLSASFSDDKIAWSENTDGLGTFGPQHVITTAAGGARSVHAADLDGDGDADVLSASFSDGIIAWYENTDGLGTFGPQQVITTAADGARSVHAADLDGDGDADVLSASQNDGKIAWYENTDGLGSFGPQQVITTAADGAISVHAADLDGDGDGDVLSASFSDDKIAWYENTDGLGSFDPQQVITTTADGAISVHAADLDGDADVDVLSASLYDDKIAWYENTDGLGGFGPQQVITTAADSAISVHAADIDGDGDADVLSASQGDDKIAWYRNSAGITSLSPSSSVFHDQVFVTIGTEGFSTVGQTLVHFGRVPATNVVWVSGSDLVCLSPPGSQGEVVDVTITQGGLSTAFLGAFTYVGTTITGLDEALGNLEGSVITLSADYTTDVADTTVTVDGQPAVVLDVTPTTITIQTTPVLEATGLPVDIAVSTTDGADTLAGAFTYTPTLAVGITGDVTAGRADLVWQTDPAAPGSQAIWIWLGNPSMQLSPGASIFGYSGLLYEVPLLYLLTGFPDALGPVSFPFGPLDPALADIPFFLQAFVSGEGDVNGSFTNPVQFVIPSSGM